ncbi:MAG: hypothetical protein SOV03_02720, partial [Faecalibacterium sp.]|nr:hypothetical protein [Faecalibacterium sp.]
DDRPRHQGSYREVSFSQRALQGLLHRVCGSPFSLLPAVILPKYPLSVCAMCTNKRANGCFLVDKSQK